jgi:hypothetical protein
MIPSQQEPQELVCNSIGYLYRGRLHQEVSGAGSAFVSKADKADIPVLTSIKDDAVL